MSEHPILKKPPIVEAVFEVQMSIPDEDCVKTLAAMHGLFAENYPKKEEIHIFELGVAFQAKGPEALGHDRGVKGFKFTSSDGLQIIQCRRDAFTFHRLAPYESWEHFIAGAGPAWSEYRSQFPNATVTRVGLRYVNSITIPMGGDRILLEDYFKMCPPDAPSPDLIYTGFMVQSVFANVKTGLNANWILAHQPPKIPSSLHTLLDIDVFDFSSRIQEIDPRNLLEQMRKFKNNLFFNSFTTKGMELFQ